MRSRTALLIVLLICHLSVQALSVQSLQAETVLGPAGLRVQETVTKIQTLVRAEKGKTDQQALNKKVEDLIRPVFDFDEMSKRSLGVNWQRATDTERKEFVSLFSALLADTYIKKVVEGVESSTVSYLSEKADNDRALLRTQIDGENGQIKVDYRLRLSDGSWTVYDVVIENVGLVSNYRNEFSGIVRNDGMEGLLQRLREKKVAPAAG